MLNRTEQFPVKHVKRRLTTIFTNFKSSPIDRKIDYVTKGDVWIINYSSRLHDHAGNHIATIPGCFVFRERSPSVKPTDGGDSGSLVLQDGGPSLLPRPLGHLFGGGPATDSNGNVTEIGVAKNITAVMQFFGGLRF